MWTQGGNKAPLGRYTSRMNTVKEPQDLLEIPADKIIKVDPVNETLLDAAQ